MMKKHLLLISNLIIILFILVGFAGMTYKDTRAYQDLAEKHLENTVSLADLNISAQIQDTMEKPVMVSKTMANDEFLKAWLVKEPEQNHDAAFMQQLYGYLKAYQLKYKYLTVFFVSAQTGNYYYQDGQNKTISETDAHDIWYYNFLATGQEYDLEVDTNEAHGDRITLFINFRVEGSDGELLGVVGVGLHGDRIEKAIRTYEENYDLRIYIVNQLGAENSFSGETDIFISREDLNRRTGISEKVELVPLTGARTQWFNSQRERICLITRYNDTLGWHLLLEKNISSMEAVFHERIKANVIFMLVSLAACIFVTTAVSLHYKRKMVTLENTDDLTGLCNRKLFCSLYEKFIRRQSGEKTLFMFDVDCFKNINDTRGHLFGNAVLAAIGEELQSAVKGRGIAARWGGDEFLAVLPLGLSQTRQAVSELMDRLKDPDIHGEYCAKISVGMAEVNPQLTTEQMIELVDQALYRSKTEGRDRITVYPTGGKTPPKE